MRKFILLFSLLLSSLTMSANSFGKIHGNGKVTTKERALNADFHSVDARHGIDVYLIPGNTAQVKVEADENLHDVIETEVSNGVLRISTNKNIGRSTRKNVYVTYVNLKSLTAESGADIKAKEVLKAQHLNLFASSGGDIEISILSEEVVVKASSGGDIDLKGKTIKIHAEANSGGDIDAEHLEAIHAIANAGSGGSVEVNVKTSIEASASSGGKVEYSGNPSEKNIKSNVSGRVKKK